MKTVWKFPIRVTDEPQIVTLPRAHKFLAVRQSSSVTIDLWAEVDTESGRTEREVWVHGTGHPQDGGGSYIGTAFDDGHAFVWHVYAGVAR